MTTSTKVETVNRFRWLLITFVVILGSCDGASDSSLDAVVSGNSMAPAFWGEHVEVRCHECGYSFRVGEKLGELPNRLVCPNCGDRSIDSATAQTRSAQRVRVIPYRRHEGAPELNRWDVVAVRASEDRPAMIKRVVGLPGESIQFVDGDVFANGTLVRKSLDEAAAMRVPVFDSQFDSADTLRRLRPQGDAKDWTVDQNEWKYAPSSASEETRWLAYKQWRCVSGGLDRDQVVPVEDWYAANVNVNRNLNATRDVWARMEIQAADECRLDLAVELGANVYAYRIDFGAGRVFFGGESVSIKADDLNAVASVNRKGQPFQIDVCTFDRRLTLTLNGRKVSSFDLPLEAPEAQSLSMIRIGGTETPMVVKRFQLWRDIYYFGKRAQRAAGENAHLIAGSNECLLVGDNVPVSIDSRHWPVPAVSRDEILGSVE